MWTHQKRPAAFLSIYALYDSPEGNRRLTFQSLTKSSLSATYEDTEIWKPKSPGVKFVELTAAELKGIGAPRKTATLRRAQFSRLARKFRGKIIESESNTDRFRELRLLTKELYRYDCPEQKVVDGALFAFVDGTDPELLLFVEAQQKAEKMTWYYASVRAKPPSFAIDAR